MNLKTQKRLAADVLGCSQKRVRFDQEALESISEAIQKGHQERSSRIKAYVDGAYPCPEKAH